MSKKQKMIFGVLLIVLLAGLAFLFVSMNDSDSSDTSISQTTENENNQADDVQSNETKEFSPLATTNESFIVELESEDATNDMTYSGTVSFDGQGNYLLEGIFKNDRLRFYDINGEFISCQNDTCFALPTGENGVDTSTYAYTEETIEEYKNNAEYVGRSDCPAGSCDTWNITTDDGTNITFYVADGGKISKSEGTINESSFVAVFRYEPVTITAPENVQPNPML